MLNQLSEQFSAPPAASPDGHALFPLLNTYSAHLAGHGIFNCLISNGEWLYAYCGTKLHTITRRARPSPRPPWRMTM